MFNSKEETKVTLEAENYMVGVLIDRFGNDRFKEETCAE